MARKRRIWFRKWDNSFYSTFNGEKIKLGTADDPKQLIQSRFDELSALADPPDVLTVQHVCKQFLAFCQRHRAAASHDWYEDYLLPFMAHLKAPCPIDKLTPASVTKWVDDAYGEKSSATRHAALRAVTRAMNWAVKERIIERSPLIGLTKPTAGSREVVLTPIEYKRCLRKSRGAFRDAVEFLYETGCRPQELRAIEVAWWEDNAITLPLAKSKGKKKRRVIYLNQKAKDIVVKYAADYYEGRIFRNSRGKPWTKSSLNCAFRRLKAKTGIPGLCAYALRHTRITELLKNGADVATVAALMGNSPRMILEVYQHVARDEDHLLKAITGSGD